MSAEIKFEDVVTGEGREAKKGALITAHYRGQLSDGTEFDSSYEKGRPFQTVLSKNKIIQGWFLGIQGMREGGKRKLWVPAELGYGDRQVGKIPAGSDLYFEIELIEALNRDD